MKLLIVAATRLEVEPIMRFFLNTECENIYKSEFNNIRVVLLISGIGLVASATNVARELAINEYDLVLNVGLAGVYHRSINLNKLFLIEKDTIADLGISTTIEFIPMYETGLIKQSDCEFTFSPGRFIGFFNSLDRAIGITKNTVTGYFLPRYDKDAEDELFIPSIETMEGAAVYYAAYISKVNCVQIRAISNYVGDRDMNNWTIQEAVLALSDYILNLIEKLESAY